MSLPSEFSQLVKLLLEVPLSSQAEGKGIGFQWQQGPIAKEMQRQWNCNLREMLEGETGLVESTKGDIANIVEKEIH